MLLRRRYKEKEVEASKPVLEEVKTEKPKRKTKKKEGEE